MKLLPLTSGALGAGVTYFFDPDRGRSRRIRAHDQALHLKREARRLAGVTVRDLNNRTKGVLADVRTSLSRENVPDDVLVARVRAGLGRVTSHPRLITVAASNGAVTISGDALARESGAIRSAVRSTRGVQSVHNELKIHLTEDMLELQGGRHRNGRRHNLLKTRWSPATRLLAGIAGSALAVYGIRRRGVAGVIAGGTALVVLVRAFLPDQMLAPSGKGE
jgi:hypothetical protein